VEPKEFQVQRTIPFNKIYATNLIGYWTEYDFRMELFNEKINTVAKEGKEEWTFISEGLVIMTPLAAKKLNKLLTGKIKEYESEKGEITETPAEILKPSI